MPQGYLVTLGDGRLDPNDSIGGPRVTFTTDEVLGGGSWVWSGTAGGTTYTNEQEPGSYELGTDGNVYFIPSFGPVDTITSASVVTAPSYPSDDIVSGTDGDDTIDAAYVDDDGDQVGSGDDTIDAGTGNDDITTLGGADTIYAGDGSDIIDSGDGDDVIYGDSTIVDSSARESLQWGDEGTDGTDLTAGFTQNTGDIDVTVTVTDLGGLTSAQVSTDTQYVAGLNARDDSALEIRGTGNGGSGVSQSAEIQFDFTSATAGVSDSVSGLKFRINDIDQAAWDDRVTVRAYDSDGNELTVNFTPEGNVTQFDPDTLDGGGPNTSAASVNGSALITIDGPVARVEIIYENAGTAAQALWITDLRFDPVPVSENSDDTITAGAGDDTVFGQGGDDTIDGDAGDDTIDGGSGNDTIRGGTGADTLYGRTGNDTIFGGANNDEIYGGTGDDTLSGGGGSDTVEGGSGNDIIDGNGGADTLDGGAGDDTIRGGNGNDTLRGGDGNDDLDGGSGNDDLEGGDGDDTLTGGTGDDTLDGGAGDDQINFAEGDSATGGDGDDTFTLQDFGEAGAQNITIVGGEGNETLGDTLQLGTLADLSTLIITNSDDNAGGLSGTVTLDDGSILTFSEIENIICFTPGTRIATPQGFRNIEELAVGDLVVTRDHGLQPIRWIEGRRVPAVDRFAPIRIRPGVMTGAERDLLVSPQHRMLFQGYRAELLFGESEVLVAAKHLIDGKLVTREEGGEVTYIHMMFDTHEIIFAEGAATESFHPGDMGLSAVGGEARDELFALFPHLRADQGEYGETARRVLKKHEAGLIK